MVDARNAILQANVLQDGHFIFADGDHATQKLEMDRLFDNEESLETILELLQKADTLPEADVMLGVPSGGQRLAQELETRELIAAPLVLLERIPGGAKQDFRFVTSEGRRQAKSARSVRIYEDVVTTLSSIAGVVKLLDPSRQDIHSLAIWRRGRVKDEYRQGITDHYLIEELMPSFKPGECPVCMTGSTYPHDTPL